MTRQAVLQVLATADATADNALLTARTHVSQLARGLVGSAIPRGVLTQADEHLQSAITTTDEAIAACIEKERRDVDQAFRVRNEFVGSAERTAGVAGSGRAPQLSVQAIEIDQLNSAFDRLANDNSSWETWTGADSTYSVTLPDGRVAWIFSDTFLGTIAPDGSRLLDPDGQSFLMISNSFVVQDGDQLTTVHGGVPGAPRSIIEGTDLGYGASTLWAGAAQVHDGMVEVVFRRYNAYAVSVGTAIATFDPADLSRPVSVDDRSATPFVSWGSAIHRFGGYTYVYGTEDDPSRDKYLRLARVEGDSLLGTWEYRTADGTWSDFEPDAARLLAGVSNEFSVTPFGEAFLLVTSDTTTPLSPDIVGYLAPSPYGPFEGKTLLYRAPEAGANGVYQSQNVYAHNAHAHPNIDRGPDGLLVSYNVHAWNPPENPGTAPELLDDATVYRPRFVTIRLDV